MVSWTLPARLVGRKVSPDTSDNSSQESNPPIVNKDDTRTKMVRFDLGKTTVHRHYSLGDLTAQEFKSMWVTDDEFMASKKEYIAVVRMMMKTIGELPETEDYCTRGLEFKTKDGSYRRKRTKKRACCIVLDEQEIQREEGIIDADFLADVYREITGPSSLEALNRGLKDQKVMLDLLDDDVRLQWEEQKGRKKGVSTLDTSQRRRSLTETLNLNGPDTHQQRRCVPA